MNLFPLASKSQPLTLKKLILLFPMWLSFVNKMSVHAFLTVKSAKNWTLADQPSTNFQQIFRHIW